MKANTNFRIYRDRIVEILYKKLNAGIAVYCMVATTMSALAAEEPEGGDLRSAVQNPISSLISVPLKFTFDFGAETGWRIGTAFLFTICGMALGGWLAGVIYDATGSYTWSYVNAIAFNVMNLTIAASLLRRYSRLRTSEPLGEQHAPTAVGE